MSAEKFLAPRDAATDDDESEVGSVVGPDYDSEGTIEEKTVEESPERGSDRKGGQRGMGEADNEIENQNENRVNAEGGDEGEENEGRGGGGRKVPREPYDVPTSGAFYMHDDRFVDVPVESARKGERKNRSGVDDDKWKHDKFEELERDFEAGKPAIRGPRRGGRRNRGSRSDMGWPNSGSRKGKSFSERRQSDGRRDEYPVPVRQMEDMSLRDSTGSGQRGRTRGGRGYSDRSR